MFSCVECAETLSDYDQAITTCGLWYWLTENKFVESDIYFAQPGSEYDQILKALTLPYNLSNFRWAMENMDYIAKNSWEKWIELRLKTKRENQVRIVNQFKNGEITEVEMITLLEEA
jgi:hypothetical protein